MTIFRADEVTKKLEARNELYMDRKTMFMEVKTPDKAQRTCRDVR